MTATMRPAGGYFFEDYRLGQRFTHAVPRTLTSGDTALYQALTGSRNPLHCSEPFARSLGHRATPVDDLLVFHIAFGKTVSDISYNAVANLGYADCRFVKPVYVGDTLTADTEIVGLKGNSNGKTGVVYVRSNCHNQHGELVLTWVRWVMVHRRQAVAAQEWTALGETGFSTQAASDAIVAPGPRMLADDAVASATGCGMFWDDIAVAEPGSPGPETNGQIRHPAGLTIDETDHTLATKLYQNNARVHFDALHMSGSRFGRRLVYGGHIISVCRALTFDGLGNALAILAINGGSHVNPTFAGETIFATSTPRSKWPLDRQWGAVRFDLRGLKNLDPADAAFEEKAAAATVLSLDYTVLMPRRTR
jgi:2-methylfumaryl-CoA hydratase